MQSCRRNPSREPTGCGHTDDCVGVRVVQLDCRAAEEEKSGTATPEPFNTTKTRHVCGDVLQGIVDRKKTLRGVDLLAPLIVVSSVAPAILARATVIVTSTLPSTFSRCLSRSCTVRSDQNICGETPSQFWETPSTPHGTCNSII